MLPLNPGKHGSQQNAGITLALKLRDNSNELQKQVTGRHVTLAHRVDLAPRTRELKVRQDELTKTMVRVEAEIEVRGVDQVDAVLVKSYANDLRSLLEERAYGMQGFPAPVHLGVC